MPSAKVYMVPGGDEQVLASGGKTTVQSGGQIDMESGSTIRDDGTQASAISDITITYSSNDPSITPDGAVTVADGSAATVGELLELAEELISQTDAINAALRGVGIIAT